MKIILCIKPVRTELVYPNEKRNEKYVINPYDLKALEECASMKTAMNSQIIVLSMGTEATKETLTKALAIGADEAYLISDKAFAGSDTVATSYILSKAINKIGKFDLLVCGEKSVDGETGQVVYGLAERQKLLCISQVKEFHQVDDKEIILTRETNGYYEKIKAGYPLVIAYKGFCMDKGNMSLLALKRARGKEIFTWDVSDLDADREKCGLTGSKTTVLEIKNDLVKKESVIISGNTEEKAIGILNILNKKSKQRYAG